jgi:pimeloyl-ACP methyl ester carboxylesterase
LSRQGYPVRNLGYPSRRFNIEHLVSQVIAPAFAELPGTGPVYWVTHSLGGILLRCLVNRVLDNTQRERITRVVMLAPPNQGSALVDTLRQWPLLPQIMGPAFLQLGTDDRAIWRELAQCEEQRPVGWQVGVIAGTRSWEPWFSHLLDGENDGKVAVASAHWPSATAAIRLPVNHTTLMRDARVLAQISHFLAHGQFSASATEGE